MHSPLRHMHSQEMQSGLFIQAADFPETSAGHTGTQLRHIHTLCPCSPITMGSQLCIYQLLPPCLVGLGDGQEHQVRPWPQVPAMIHREGWASISQGLLLQSPCWVLLTWELDHPQHRQRRITRASVVKPTRGAGRLGNHLHAVTGRCQGKICSPVTESINTHTCADTQRAQFNY